MSVDCHIFICTLMESKQSPNLTVSRFSIVKYKTIGKPNIHQIGEVKPFMVVI